MFVLIDGTNLQDEINRLSVFECSFIELILQFIQLIRNRVGRCTKTQFDFDKLHYENQTNCIIINNTYQANIYLNMFSRTPSYFIIVEIYVFSNF